MAHIDLDYLEHCKSQIEDKFSFSSQNSQRDLELLSEYIENNTGVYISLSTLKRVWKNDYKNTPQLATLNALVSTLGYENWQHFKIENRIPSAPALENRFKKYQWALLMSIPFLLLIYSLIPKSPDKVIMINGPITFKSDQTKTKGVPNTTLFEYDVSNVKADSFFIQQSWNQWRKKKIDPQNHFFTSIYYESGFHRARLIANDSTIAIQPIHILSQGWEPHLYYDQSDDRFIDFQGESFIEKGVLHLDQDLLQAKKVNFNKPFHSRISHSMEYNVSSSNFSFQSIFKLDSLSTSNCPWMRVQIVTEKHIFYTKLVLKGCEAFANYKLGEIVRSGENNDLKSLGLDIFSWQNLSIVVTNQNAQILTNDILVYEEKYNESFGMIKGISFIFDGVGSIQFVELKDAHDEVRYQTNFEDYENL